MCRLAALAACCALLAAPCAAAATQIMNTGGSQEKGSVVPPKSWDAAQIRYVVTKGLMAKSVSAFRPNDVLTRGELATLVADLTKQPKVDPPDPSAPVTVAQLDTSLVKALRLG